VALVPDSAETTHNEVSVVRERTVGVYFHRLEYLSASGRPLPLFETTSPKATSAPGRDRDRVPHTYGTVLARKTGLQRRVTGRRAYPECRDSLPTATDAKSWTAINEK